MSLGILIALAVPFNQVSGLENGQRLPILITQPVDDAKLVTLRGNTRPEAKYYKDDRGPVPDDFPMPHMLFQLKRAPQLEKELAQYIETLTDKSSPNYHHWMLAQEQGEKYGLAQEDLDAITGWLKSHGFTVGYVYPNRMVIDFSGTAGQIREAFHTDIHYLEVNGEQHFANMSDQKIPKALAPAVVGVVSMNNFKPHPMLVPAADYTFSGCATSTDRPTGPGTCYALVPADFQVIYNLNPLYRLGFTGTGHTITLVEDSNTYDSDVATYRSTFLHGFTLGTFSTIQPSASGQPTCSTPGTNADDSEADLDAEIASAIAPGANITVASCAAGATTGVLIAVQNLVNGTSPPEIISMSYGECEALSGASLVAAFNSAFETGAGAGVSIFASSGDYGAGGCAPGYTTSYTETGIGITGWGETVYNVSVGGTDFEDVYNSQEANPVITPLSTYWSSSNTGTDGSAKSYIPEIPWNDSCASALIANYVRGSFNTYGASGTGMCNTSPYNGTSGYLSALAGAGGPSGCATGQGTDQADYGVVDTDCTGYAKPTWQSGVYGNPADGVRDIPDVALFAANGIWGHYAVICWSDTSEGGTSCSGAPSTWSGFGGTSVAAPAMAAIQSLVNEKWGFTKEGNPNPTYYTIAKSEFGSSGNSNCYSINQPPRHGLGTACAFYDITQGDNDIPCRYNGASDPTGCYRPSTNGVLSTQALTNGYVTNAGSGYTGTPTCTLGEPSNLNTYLSPTGSTLWAGGSLGSCTLTKSGNTIGSVTISVGGTGYAGGASCTISGGSGSGATCTASPLRTTAPSGYEPAYGATPGWDFATGIGSVNAYNLVFNSAW
jgi:subtilase family serine protease